MIIQEIEIDLRGYPIRIAGLVSAEDEREIVAELAEAAVNARGASVVILPGRVGAGILLRCTDIARELVQAARVTVRGEPRVVTDWWRTLRSIEARAS